MYSVQYAATETCWTAHPATFGMPSVGRPRPAIWCSAGPCSVDGEITFFGAGAHSPSTTNLIEFATSLAYSFIIALPKCHIIVGADWPLKARSLARLDPSQYKVLTIIGNKTATYCMPC
jgi:hypothetical protein